MIKLITVLYMEMEGL